MNSFAFRVTTISVSTTSATFAIFSFLDYWKRVSQKYSYFQSGHPRVKILQKSKSDVLKMEVFSHHSSAHKLSMVVLSPTVKTEVSANGLRNPVLGKDLSSSPRLPYLSVLITSHPPCSFCTSHTYFLAVPEHTRQALILQTLQSLFFLCGMLFLSPRIFATLNSIVTFMHLFKLPSEANCENPL